MENIYSVARYFLSKESMSHKKLQKLCYYAQAWYLANFKEILVPNRFEAWAHGPVCPDLYNYYRDWGWEQIPKWKSGVTFNDDNTSCFLDEVFNVYGDYDADTLEVITHREEPWQRARHGLPAGAYSRNPISLKDMQNYYGERIKNQ